MEKKQVSNTYTYISVLVFQNKKTGSMLVPMFSKDIYGSFKINSAFSVSTHKRGMDASGLCTRTTTFIRVLGYGRLGPHPQIPFGNWKKMEDVF